MIFKVVLNIDALSSGYWSKCLLIYRCTVILAIVWFVYSITLKHYVLSHWQYYSFDTRFWAPNRHCFRMLPQQKFHKRVFSRELNPFSLFFRHCSYHFRIVCLLHLNFINFVATKKKNFFVCFYCSSVLLLFCATFLKKGLPLWEPKIEKKQNMKWFGVYIFFKLLKFFFVQKTKRKNQFPFQSSTHTFFPSVSP